MRNLDSCRCWRCTFCPCKVRNKFLVNFDVEYIYGFVMLGGFVRKVDDVTAYLAAQPSRLRAHHRNKLSLRMYCCCCRCILHLQQYSRRLNLFFFENAPFFCKHPVLNLGARVSEMWWALRSGLIMPREWSPSTHWMWGCVDKRADVDSVERRKWNWTTIAWSSMPKPGHGKDYNIPVPSLICTFI